QMADDANRGYRRMVPSPAPLAIVEGRAVRLLVDAGFLVIASGGGGIPTVRAEGDALTGVDAVVDKDLAAARLATAIGAGLLVLATAVDGVLIGCGPPRAAPVEEWSGDEAEPFLRGGQFAAGSMAQKREAAAGFVREGGDLAITPSPELVLAAARGDHGTRVVPGRL